MSVEELQAIGVSADVAAIMVQFGAGVIDNNGLLLRTCAHGVRHAVARLDGVELSANVEKRPHEEKTTFGSKAAACCEAQCCEAWLRESGYPLRADLREVR